jgi:tRNA-dihydrouridine synthase B
MHKRLERPFSIMLKIGNVALPQPFFQTALSGYSDRAMREIAREFGSPLTVPGVMLDTSVIHMASKPKKRKLIACENEAHPIAAQIMGATAENMVAAAKIMEELNYDIIDLNFACPVPKVLRRERGGYMMSQPDVLVDMYKQIKDAVNVPVTMKIRAGYDETAESIEKFWEICERTVAHDIDALMIHGRNVVQRYRGFPDWKILAEVKQKFPDTTLLTSGNLFSAKTVVKRLAETKCDGALIARGCIGNPWIFKEIISLLDGTPYTDPTVAEQGDVILRHFNTILQDYPEVTSVFMFRKFTAKYTRRHPDKTDVHLAMMKAVSKDELYATIKEYYGVENSV